jgi:purine-nucleoside phosphorylase
VREAAAFLERRISLTPKVGLVLGSGLGGYADRLEDRSAVEYGEIPGFPVPTVAGHAGRLVVGRKGPTAVAALQGRFHLYEGHDPETVVRPLRLLKLVGVETLVITNAAGGVRAGFKPGDLMLIEDLINFQFRPPLRGTPGVADPDRFVDMSRPFSRRLIEIAEAAALEHGVSLTRGTYWGNLGPTYETPAEVRMIRRLGGDAVGMSTVPEVAAAGRLSHAEVLEATTAARDRFSGLLDALLPRVASPDR